MSRRLRLPAGLPAWTPFEVAVPIDKTEAEIAAIAAHAGSTVEAVKAEVERQHREETIFKNSRYQVHVRRFHAVGVEGGPMVHLSIRRLDRKRPGPERWRDFQRIKNELCAPDAEACELYPAELRLVDGADQYHLWVLPWSRHFPFGFTVRDVSYGMIPGMTAQTPLEGD